MAFLYIFTVLVIIWIAYMRFEATYLEVKHIRFAKSKECLKILQLSDIHINFLKVSYEKVKAAVQKEKPDVIAITGDYIEKSRDIPALLNFMDILPADTPVYMCLGNHDYKALGKGGRLKDFVRRIEQRNVRVLRDEVDCFVKNGKKYNIIGIEDLREGVPNVNKALKSASRDSAANIAISHNPDIIFQLPAEHVDYLLCGHFHGGQIWAPFDLEFKVLRHDRLCRMGVKRGLHILNGINLYINRGLGNVCFPLRFLSRPEITVFYLE